MKTSRKKTLVFHGTSAENYERILAEGFSEDRELTWYNSEHSKIYFYELEKMIEVESINKKDREWGFELCVNRAMEQAKITAALNRSSAEWAYVLVYEVPIHIVNPDADNTMACSASVEIEVEDLKGLKPCKVFKSEYYTGMQFMYLQGVGMRSSLNIYVLSNKEQELLKIISKSTDSFYDLLFDYDTPEEIQSKAI